MIHQSETTSCHGSRREGSRPEPSSILSTVSLTTLLVMVERATKWRMIFRDVESTCLQVVGLLTTTYRTCPRMRSEEHTSELQSQSNLVCRLLLEKKKNTTSPRNTIHRHTYH